MWGLLENAKPTPCTMGSVFQLVRRGQIQHQTSCNIMWHLPRGSAVDSRKDRYGAPAFPKVLRGSW
jgi:hypothetical protein